MENYLERAVDSAIDQTLEGKEIILVDDGSTDASPQICDRYAEQYPDLIRVIHQENAGLGMARNAGVHACCGEYILFMDSDDTIEPEMCAQLYRKAVEGGYDIVMCDVRILYVEEDRTSVVSAYPHGEVDLSDYIANGNNITYSVNKLFRRAIWEENQYEKMLFEDIALIPSIVTRYPKIGYVPKPFYNYFRRPNTLSTSLSGEMADIVRAFRLFLTTSAPAYHEEVVYCIAKQLLWNMTQSRPLFRADFITFIREFEADFRLNPYLARDPKVKKILDELDRPVIPEQFICVHWGRPIPSGYREALARDFPYARLIDEDGTSPLPQPLPDSVRHAMAEGNLRYAEEYLALRRLYEEGGIILTPETQANLNLKRLRLNTVFFGFECEEELTTGCFGAVKGHYVIKGLLDSYEGDSIFNRAGLPLRDRLRDFLILHFNLRVNGRKQFLKHEIPVYLPDVLAYDMKNGENCARNAAFPTPEGYELVRDSVLKMWSDRILENWSLYKQELAKSPPAKGGRCAPAKPPSGAPRPEVLEQELDKRTREVMENYERSLSWRITKPVRAIGRLLKRKGRSS